LPATGSQATVAVVDAFDDPNAETDLAVYRARFGLSACTSATGCFRKINQYGQPASLPAADTGWAGEISLDLDAVSAACPSCRLLLVEANGHRTVDFATAVAQAARSGAVVISNSYGGPEDGHETRYDPYYYHPGIAVIASTGDDGYGPNYPATSPYVLAVGGTTLTRAANARGWAESAWRHGAAGCSTDEPRPQFQQTVITGCNTRAVADVSAVADPATGIAGYDSYHQNGWQVFGGTSVAAPLIAGIYGLIGGTPPATLATTLPYQHPQGFYDITTGSDRPCRTIRQLCSAGPGYDQPTGLGTPHGITAFTP
jgi:subtilase family serine protease